MAEKALDATEDHFWIYDGGLPPLDAWRVTFSLRGHTARVSGLLPDGWRRPLPSYAVERPGPAGRREVHVVYPVSTAGPGSSNADPGRYRRLASWSHTPSNVSNEGVSWGGFPYLEFDAGRNIAFHGPISVELQQQRPVWRLQRGAVSHGCARMQGEHVVELAHLVGLDMGVPEELDVTFGTWEEGDFLVEVLEGYDAFEGAVVDVDYPAATGFERPTGEGVRVFSTWSSDDHPRFVCAHEPDRTLGEGHCGHLEAATRSSVRAVDLGRVECPAPFVAQPVGTEGGVVCSDGARAVGPRTEAMLARCRAWGGGVACEAAEWSLQLTVSIRGDGVCPVGAALDYHDTGYCEEEGEALGGFPAGVVAECAGLGATICSADRWPRDVLSAALERLRR